MIKIAKDTPKKLVAIIKRIDFSKIPVQEHQSKIIALQGLLNKYSNYLPRRQKLLYANDLINLDVENCPQSAADLMNQVDWGKVNMILQMTAAPIIEKYLKDNKLYN